MDVQIDVSNTVINTDRLILRPLELTDLEDFNAYASVAGVGEMAGWKHHESMDESKSILQMIIGRKEVFAIVHKADQKVIGTIGLHSSWANEEEAYRQYRVKEIGYVLSKAYWGQGLMPEALGAVIAYSFNTLELDALTCCHFTENSQSRRVIEKCGFRFVKRGTYTADQLLKTFEDMQYILIRGVQRED